MCKPRKVRLGNVTTAGLISGQRKYADYFGRQVRKPKLQQTRLEIQPGGPAWGGGRQGEPWAPAQASALTRLSGELASVPS